MIAFGGLFVILIGRISIRHGVKPDLSLLVVG